MFKWLRKGKGFIPRFVARLIPVVSCILEDWKILSISECSPKICGRYVSDDIVTAKETEILLKFAVDSINLGGSSGGASILDLHSGALSKDEHFVDVYQWNPEILNHAILKTDRYLFETFKYEAYVCITLQK